MTIEADSATIRQLLNESFQRKESRDQLESVAKHNVLLAKKLYTSNDLWLWWRNLLDDKIKEIIIHRATNKQLAERESNMLDGKLETLLELQGQIKNIIEKGERIQEADIKKEREQAENKTE